MPFAMPSVEVGDEAMFYTEVEGGQGSIVLVSAVHNRCIDGLVLGSFRHVRGIRHRSDPDLKDHVDLLQDTGGCWEEAPKMRRLREVEEKVNTLLAKLEEMAGKRKVAA